MGTGAANAVEPQTNAAKVYAAQSAAHRDEASLARTFHQELDHARAARAANNADSTMTAAQTPVSNEAAKPELGGGRSDVELLNGQPSSDHNYTQAFLRFGPMPRVGPLGRYGPMGRGAPIEEAPIIRPAPTPVQPQNPPPGTGVRPPVPLTGPTDSGEPTPKDGPPEAPKAQPEQTPQAKPDTPPPAKTEEKTECEKADRAQGSGATVPPTPADIDRLVAEHSQDTGSPPLTHAAANSIVAQTQPPGTEAKIVGQGVPGPDIIYIDSCTKKEVDTVQVKSIAGFRGFDGQLSKELNKDAGQSRIIAFQVPENTDVGQWMGRYWGNRIKENSSGWTDDASKHAHREVLIADNAGKILFRGPVFDPMKAK